MSLHRRAARRDHNEQAIIDALIAAGASVRPWSAKGAPDLCVGYRGVTHLLEVKAPAGPRGGTKHNHAELTGAQIEWRKGWAGAPPVIVRTPAEALAAIGAMIATEPAPSHGLHCARCGCSYMHRLHGGLRLPGEVCGDQSGGVNTPEHPCTGVLFWTRVDYEVRARQLLSMAGIDPDLSNHPSGPCRPRSTP